MNKDTHSLHQHHPRDYDNRKYVYPVISRRARGVSVGINLSPTGLCNFQCVYCQYDGQVRLTDKSPRVDFPDEQLPKTLLDILPSPQNLLPDYADDMVKLCHVRTSNANRSFEIDLTVLEEELRQTLTLALSGELFKSGTFATTPPPFRRVNDIAFSGNGEPTLSPQFADAARIVVKVRDELKAPEVKPVVITNATVLQKPRIAEGIGLVMAAGGEIWAKLDAGRESFYKQINRSRVPFQTIIDNITDTAKRNPIVLQSLFLRLHGQPMPEEELLAYIDRLREIRESGGQIKLVQLYTLAREAAETWVAPLTNEELDAFANRIRNETGLPVETFYGAG